MSGARASVAQSPEDLTRFQRPVIRNSLIHLGLIICCGVLVGDKARKRWETAKEKCLEALASGYVFLDLHSVARFFVAMDLPPEVKTEVTMFCNEWHEFYRDDLCNHLRRVCHGSEEYDPSVPTTLHPWDSQDVEHATELVAEEMVLNMNPAFFAEATAEPADFVLSPLPELQGGWASAGIPVNDGFQDTLMELATTSSSLEETVSHTLTT